MTKCLILAAGKGQRLYPLTKNKPKCLVKLFNKPILEHQIDLLRECGIKNIAIVGGYEIEKLKKYDLQIFNNKNFSNTNMVESLFCAQDFFEDGCDDLLISYGDIIYQKNNLYRVLQGCHDISLMIDKGWIKLWSLRLENPLEDAETLKIDEDGFIYEIGNKPNNYSEIDGQYTGLFKISKAKLKSLVDFRYRLYKENTISENDLKNMYMTDLFQLLIKNNWKIGAVLVNHGWLEVDTYNDYKIYEKLFKEDRLFDLWSN